MGFSNYKEYYLIKCFSKEKHREDFNSGENIHLASCEYFHRVENDFQKDFEGVIFKQDEDQNGYLFYSPNDIIQLIKDYNSGRDSKSFDIMQTVLNNSKIICKTKDFKIFVNGYLCCFYLIRKRQVIFNDKEIHFPCKNDYIAFFDFLKKYSDNGYAYLSVYDAETLLTILCNKMYSKGYNYTYGLVEYENLSQKEKIKYLYEGNIHKIVFTKDKSFEYQKEFRIFFTHKNHTQSEFIEEKICPLSKSVINNCVYLSPDYYRKNVKT